MGARERTEDALRAMHILVANAEYAPGSGSRVVIDKEEIQSILKELGDCLYQMMDESELTESSHARAERSMKKQADLWEERARKRAEDIYAGSIMYSDRALNELGKLLNDAQSSIERIHSELIEKVDEEKKQIRKNQYELKGQLNDLKDTQKYLRLIEDENKRLEKLEKSGEFTEEASGPSYADIKPEIHVNPAFFKNGDIPAGTISDVDDIKPVTVDPEELDQEYFDWKDGSDQAEEGTKKKGLFSVFKK